MVAEDILHHFVSLQSEVYSDPVEYLRWSYFMEIITASKQRIQHWCFPVNIAKFLRTPFLINHI